MVQSNLTRFVQLFDKTQAWKSFLGLTSYLSLVLLGAGITLSASYLVSRNPLSAQQASAKLFVVPAGLAATALTTHQTPTL